MRRFYMLIASALTISTGNAQELFPLTEPASTMPKQVFGVRAINQSYTEPNGQFRTMFAARLLYGLTPRLTVMLTGTLSNHHSKDLPPDFPDHNTPQIGVPLPMRFNGVNLYAKYRFLSIDDENMHFRTAAYASYSYLDVAHDEAEPNLMDDTRGFEGGVIATYLKKHFAVSVSGGYVRPSKYHGIVPDLIAGLPSVPATVQYGNAVQYSLSLGYLLFPKIYKNYNQPNINLYVELMGKSYGGAKIFFDNIGNPGTPYEVTGTGMQALSAGHYIEMHPGAQLILKSNLRIDLSVGFPVMSKSYAHFYPLYTVGVQRYFYPRTKK